MKNELKTIKHLWTIVCERASVDSLTNSVSLNSIYEEIQVKKKDSTGKASVPQKGEVIQLNNKIVSLWKRTDDGDEELVVDGQLEVVDPDGELLGKFPHQIRVGKGKLRARVIAQFNALKITEPGEYVFKLSAKDPGTKGFVDISENYLTVKFVLN